jgi:hypothetical protein
MPIDLTNYPPSWGPFSYSIRYLRANGRCECTGECGLHRPNPNPRRCIEHHHHPARFARGTICLTTAHLCHCDPPCAIPAHVKAMCQRCHLRLDRQIHALHARATWRKKRQSTRISSPTYAKKINYTSPTSPRQHNYVAYRGWAGPHPLAPPPQHLRTLLEKAPL